MYKYINFDYILSNFDIKKYNLTKIKEKTSKKSRSVYKISYLDNLFCLKQTYFSIEKILFVYSYLNWLSTHDIRIPNLIKSINNKPFVLYNDKYYILTDWISGDKLNYNNLDDCIKAITFLSKIHGLSYNMTSMRGAEINISFTNLRQRFLNSIKDSNKLHSSAQNINDEFSRRFKTYYNKFLYLAELSLNASSIINVKKLNVSVCHGDYVSKNIILNESVIPIDFDKCSINYSIYDLSYFLKRYLRHRDINWNFKNMMVLVNYYNQNHPIFIDEYLFLLAYLSFPYKFLKTSKLYFENINNLTPKEKELYVKNIDRIYKTFDMQIMFIADFKKYINSKFNLFM